MTFETVFPMVFEAGKKRKKKNKLINCGRWSRICLWDPKVDFSSANIEDTRSTIIFLETFKNLSTNA